MPMFAASLFAPPIPLGASYALLDQSRVVLTRLVAEQEERLVAAGHGDEDNSVLARVAKGEVS